MMLMGDRSIDDAGTSRGTNFFDPRWGAGRVGLVPFDSKSTWSVLRGSAVLDSGDSHTVRATVPSSATFFKVVVWHDGTDYFEEPMIGLEVDLVDCATATRTGNRRDSKAQVTFNSTPLANLHADRHHDREHPRRRFPDPAAGSTSPPTPTSKRNGTSEGVATMHRTTMIATLFGLLLAAGCSPTPRDRATAAAIDETDRAAAFAAFLDSPRPAAVIDEGLRIAEGLRRHYGIDTGHVHADRLAAARRARAEVSARPFLIEPGPSTAQPLGSTVEIVTAAVKRIARRRVLTSLLYGPRVHAFKPARGERAWRPRATTRSPTSDTSDRTAGPRALLGPAATGRAYSPSRRRCAA